tara:strand:- start:117 stop:425 length:309 start_codon:yes stop_codon:yes gene_type:complete
LDSLDDTNFGAKDAADENRDINLSIRQQATKLNLPDNKFRKQQSNLPNGKAKRKKLPLAGLGNPFFQNQFNSKLHPNEPIQPILTHRPQTANAADQGVETGQ